MTFHPHRAALLSRTKAILATETRCFDDAVFRFIKPQQSSVGAMFAGKGPRYNSGRWLMRGIALATYTSLEPETALAEALAAGRYYGFPESNSAPLVWVTAQVKLNKVLDLHDGKLRQRLRLSENLILQTDWRKINGRGNEAITQAWGWAFQTAGIEGFLCPSAAYNEGTNLIVFPENLSRTSSVSVTLEVNWPRV